MMNRFFFAVFLLLFLSVWSCESPPEKLPVIGEKNIIGKDTIYHTIPDFSFIDQDSNTVNKATFSDKIYIADFFFISCPTICPKVKAQMKRIYDIYKADDRVMFLSHTVDTRYDTIPALKRYAEKLGVEHQKWRFVTGKKEEIYSIANDYFSVAMEDENAPGGFDHSGRLLLIDKDFRVRAFCNGTQSKEVDVFMENISTLLNEY